jgi:Phage ABA sandwich domain
MNKAHDMSAGPELDALLAEKVMGWRRFDNWSQAVGKERPFFLVGESGVIVYRHPDLGKSWSPSKNMAEAWDVVEKIEATLNFQIDNPGLENKDQRRWRVLFGRSDNPISIVADADSAPLAIARAALQTVLTKS